MRSSRRTRQTASLPYLFRGDKFMQRSRRKIYDAIVVGSGATGGWAAKVLTERGMTVLVLEAGRQLEPKKDFREHTFPYELKYRGVAPGSQYAPRQPIQSKCYAANEYGHHLFVDDIDNPYTTPEDKPFWWIRGRHVGGRSVTWGRQSYRLSDYDFKAAERDGYGDPWPFSYGDLRPYYERVEDFVGISGSYENLPQLPDSNFLPPMAMTCGERMLKKSVESKFPGRNVIIGRVAILTKAHQGRAPCHYCGHCDRGCSTYSYYSSPGSTLPAAAKTGKMTLRPNAVVREIIVDPNTGKASGVRVVNQITKQDYEEYGQVIVLCASSLESTRILLNSKSRQYPEGLGNSSGVLGHYLMDHMYQISAGGVVPVLKGMEYDYSEGRAKGFTSPVSATSGTNIPTSFADTGCRAVARRVIRSDMPDRRLASAQNSRSWCARILAKSPSGSARGARCCRARRTASRLTRKKSTPGASPFCASNVRTATMNAPWRKTLLKLSRKWLTPPVSGRCIQTQRPRLRVSASTKSARREWAPIRRHRS